MIVDTLNIRFAGLGGTGTIKASDVMADAAFRSGYEVKKAEVHGMSQRGGSVSSDVRFGTQVHSPMIPEKSCDFLVVLEDSQVAVVQGGLRPDGVLLASSAIDMAKLPSAKALNVAMLGLLSTYLDLPRENWDAALRANFAPKLHEANAQAFEIGRAARK
ncbi:MAG TPA: 2-oxoacid:acceptor oxidoreductase family protein [Fibrobacteraceae bacterium]|nr:2-oxoacid:acceptor oxidoreductase family protein [Fibrobacteraceae bacterium]